jgi:hypothetical protein
MARSPRSPGFDEILRHGLIMIGAVGARAVAKGIDSALDDAGKFAKEAERRIKRTRANLEKMVAGPPRAHDEDENDDLQ